MASQPRQAAFLAARNLHAAADALLAAVAERYGINRNDLRCLELLERTGPLTSGALARASGLSPAAITKVVDRLGAAGYVERRVAPSDRRSQLLQASGAHRDLREATWSPVIEAADAVLGDLSEDDLALASDVMHRLARVSEDHALRLRGDQVTNRLACAPQPPTGQRP